MAVSEKYSTFSKTRRSKFKAKSGTTDITPSEWGGDITCVGSQATTAWTSEPVLNIGVILFTDAALENLFVENVGSIFVRLNIVYELDPVNGDIVAIRECSFQYDAYDSCDFNNMLGNIYINSTNPQFGDKVYTNPEGTSTYGNQQFSLQLPRGNFTFVTGDTGTIIAEYPCGS